MPAINHDTQDNLTQATLILVKRRSELKVALSRAHMNELKRKRHCIQEQDTTTEARAPRAWAPQQEKPPR